MGKIIIRSQHRTEMTFYFYRFGSYYLPRNLMCIMYVPLLPLELHLISKRYFYRKFSLRLHLFLPTRSPSKLLATGTVYKDRLQLEHKFKEGGEGGKREEGGGEVKNTKL